jgi:Nucleotide modification associated domain 3
MKIIFSRKGFDGDNGRVPSPILEHPLTGKMEPVFLPIPRNASPLSYQEIKIKGVPIGELVEQLTSKNHRMPAYTRAHLDPDLDEKSTDRLPGWRPAFGSTQRHLHQQQIHEGDLFLFFGLFKEARLTKNSFSFEWSYASTSYPQHVLFGWLQVAEVIYPVDPSKVIATKPWLYRHPHLSPKYYTRLHSNTLFVAADKLNLQAIDNFLPAAIDGAGMFSGVRSSSGTNYVLTDVSQSSSVWKHSLWRLPGWCVDPAVEPGLSYHAGRWQTAKPDWLLQTVGRGQEFVLNVSSVSSKQRQAVGDWLKGLFTMT